MNRGGSLQNRDAKIGHILCCVTLNVGTRISFTVIVDKTFVTGKDKRLARLVTNVRIKCPGFFLCARSHLLLMTQWVIYYDLASLPQNRIRCKIQAARLFLKPWKIDFKKKHLAIVMFPFLLRLLAQDWGQ